MKLAKSLLLGSAAGLMAVAGANAADLPVRAAAPAVDYVRVCNAYGTGFFFIPGTDTCLRVGGSVRAEINSASPSAGLSQRNRNYWTTGGRGQVFFDTRTATEMGLLRTFTRLEFAHTAGAGNVPLSLRDSYIQWGGLTVGRTSFSFFQDYTSSTMMGQYATIDAFGQGTNLLAYTATFGGGFQASISLEDNFTNTRFGWGAVGGGNRVPDVVGRIRYTGGFGSIHVAGVVKEIRTNQAAADAGVTADKFGWALTAQANVKLPMLSPGSEMWLAGTYGEGAVQYVTNTPNVTYRHFSTATADGFSVGTGISLTKAWSLATGLRYNFTPQWQANVHAAYGKVNAPTGGTLPGLGARDFEWWNVGANIAWRPVSGLAILGEVDYKAAKRQRIRATDRRNSDAWATRLRIQRDF
jgi:hypothetical protein